MLVATPWWSALECCTRGHAGPPVPYGYIPSVAGVSALLNSSQVPQVAKQALMHQQAQKAVNDKAASAATKKQYKSILEASKQKMSQVLRP